ncbi:hypothetical protein CVIRNUC_003824 [Coccomyxa viridis]|uniref:Uncharacterized protein n=1 Tax=Coccomyxa viridis TaxID=1274662 RepID=A0AAV1I3Z6_9CHLO|nr:hypothetical protein CVIRNUC_003824 [Coccomyxa viridis]
MAAARVQRYASCGRKNTLEVRIAAVEQKILEVEADISKAEAKAEKAEADKKAEDLGYWRNKTAQLRGKESQLRAEKARVEVQQQVQVALPDSSRADCARMLGDLPPVPHSIDDFQQYLLTGSVALTPSFHSFLIAKRPELQNFAFVQFAPTCTSENSSLAQSMTVLFAPTLKADFETSRRLGVLLDVR